MKTTTKIGMTNMALLVGDLVCFLVFAVLGLRSHEEGVTADGLLRAAVPFQAGWLLFSYLTGLQRRAARDVSVTDVMKAWLPAWAAGLALRTLAFDRSFAPTFGIVSLLFNSILLLAWRCLVAPRIAKKP